MKSMKSMIRFPLFLITGLCVAPLLWAKSADLILYNGKIFTSDPSRPFAQAVAVLRDRILAVGADQEVARYANANTRRIDLKQKLVIPGINDSHTHFAPMPPVVNLGLWPDGAPPPDPTFDEVKAAIVTVLSMQTPPAGTWLYADVGGRVFADPSATRLALDQVAPNHPIELRGWAGHGSIINSAAIRALQLTERESDPAGGWYERDAGGNLTGVLHGMASFGLRSCLAAAVDENVGAAQIRAVAQQAAALGITSIQNMSGLPPNKMVRILNRAGLPIRWREIPVPGTMQKCPALDVPPLPIVVPQGNVKLSGVKYILDGTPVERMAFMHERYLDVPASHFGRLYFTPGEMGRRLFVNVLSFPQPLLHVAGEATADQLLSLAERNPLSSLFRLLRPRIEHGDFLGTGDYQVLRRLRAVVVQNPTHFNIADVFMQRYGPVKTAHAQPLKSLLREGIPIALGSDGFLHPYINLLLASVHPINPAEAISREEALRAYTSGSAYAEFAEREKGTIAAGKLADLAVLSGDVLTLPLPPPPPAPPLQWFGIHSVLTMVGGAIVHQTPGLN
ncbi:MAG: amidohydrolase family protein [Bryobacteraceae bacterium]|nr:amidohydrolase family protein [Bryobacterales bacterium]MEB2364173.1 amidohydrolase family protein [Bryobacterales bacterium]NUN02490.1 amidohydrolase family protein [Bryobacteraceae bacterium]